MNETQLYIGLCVSCGIEMIGYKDGMGNLVCDDCTDEICV